MQPQQLPRILPSYPIDYSGELGYPHIEYITDNSCFADVFWFELAHLPYEEQKRRLALISKDQRQQLKKRWQFIARKNQLMPQGDWDTWLLLAGRGFGKTKAASNGFADLIAKHPGEYIIVAQNRANIQHTNFTDKKVGLITALRGSYPSLDLEHNQRDNILRVSNGSLVYGFSAEVPDNIRGKGVVGIWIDELGSCQYPQAVWDQVNFIARESTEEGTSPKFIISTTPSATSKKILKEIKEDQYTVTVTGNSYENTLTQKIRKYQQFLAAKEGTRQGKEEIFAELLEDDNSLMFKLGWIKNNREDIEESALDRVVIAFDPAKGSAANEHGIIAQGSKVRDNQLHGFVLADVSLKGTTDAAARAAIDAYHKYHASCMVIEINNGGNWIPGTIHAIDNSIVIKTVNATENKARRADPISALYEQGRIHHPTKELLTLEDQMVEFNPYVPLKRHDPSPDRMDALVWGFTHLFDVKRATAGPLPYFGPYI